MPDGPLTRPSPSPEDRQAVARLLGRLPAGGFTVAARRSDGTPAVIENAPWLDDGTPMPTRYWLVDAALREEVSRLESGGGVRRAAAEVDADALAVAHARYAAERDAALVADHRGPRPAGGVGGTRRGVKCLHAHLAWWIAGGPDPVGAWVAKRLGVRASGGVVRGPHDPDPHDPDPHDPDPTGTAPRADPAHARSGAVLAAIDCGTNSCRLLVADAAGRSLDRRMRVTRLGEGVDATHRLSGEAVQRTLEVLDGYRRAMDDLGVSRARLVATSAVRDAANAADFLGRARRETGVEPEVLTGLEEGRLSFLGATAHLPDGVDPDHEVLVVDVGGGSTELAVGRPGRLDSVSALSLDVGCVRVTERVLHHDPPTAAELDEARRLVDGALEEAVAGGALAAAQAAGVLIGLAGTVSTLASLDQGLETYDRERIHHHRLGRDTVGRWLEVLAAEDSAARRARPGMEPGRADVIVAGVLVLVEVMDRFGFGELIASEDDILDGLVASLH